MGLYGDVEWRSALRASLLVRALSVSANRPQLMRFNRRPSVSRYSDRSAIIGSRCTARRAGMQLAANATNATTATAAANETGSVGATPYNRAAKTLVRRYPAATPIPDPIVTSANASRRTINLIAAGVAPSAIQIGRASC